MDADPQQNPTPSTPPEPLLEAPDEPLLEATNPPDATTPPLDTPKKPSKMGIIILVVLFVIILAIIAYYIFFSKPKSTAQTNPQVQAASAIFTNGANSEATTTETNDSNDATNASTTADNVGDSVNENNF